MNQKKSFLLGTLRAEAWILRCKYTSLQFARMALQHVPMCVDTSEEISPTMEKWWQWRGPSEELKGEWIEMRNHYNQTEGAGGH
jgi:hypothetical protein